MPFPTSRFLLLSAAAIALVPTPGTAAPFPAESPVSAISDNEQPPLPDPPARVGRVARVQAGVGYRAPGEAGWSPAGVNLPVAGGTALQVESGGRALLELPGLSLALEGGSAIELRLLDDTALRARLVQGRLGLEVAVLEPGDVMEVATPRGTATIRKPGRYLVDAGDADTPARLVVYEGQASFADPTGAVLQAGTGQAVLAAAPMLLETAGPPSPLLAWAVSGDKAGPHPAAVAGMPGGPMLSRYGQWSTHPEYGDVWRPQVEAGWTPFRQGQWRDVQPWGWSWVDEAPWGFAPAHYGRWYSDAGVWWWAPRPFSVARGPRWPVYAPAVVRFAGVGGRGHPAGWAPLAPREPFFPGSRFSPRYLRQVNLTTVPPGFAARPLPGSFSRLANAPGAVMLPPNGGRPPAGMPPGLRGGREPLAGIGPGRLPPPGGFGGRGAAVPFGPSAGGPGFGVARPPSFARPSLPPQAFATPSYPTARPYQAPATGFAPRAFAPQDNFGGARPWGGPPAAGIAPPRNFAPHGNFGGPRHWGGPPGAGFAPQPRAFAPPSYASPSFSQQRGFAPPPQSFQAARPAPQAFAAPRSFSPPPGGSRPSFGGHRR